MGIVVWCPNHPFPFPVVLDHVYQYCFNYAGHVAHSTALNDTHVVHLIGFDFLSFLRFHTLLEPVSYTLLPTFYPLIPKGKNIKLKFI